MCIAYPGRVVAVDGSGATVDSEGRRLRAAILVIPDVRVGDWVTVAAGTIVDRLEPDDALEVIRLLRAAEAATDRTNRSSSPPPTLIDSRRS